MTAVAASGPSVECERAWGAEGIAAHARPPATAHPCSTSALQLATRKRNAHTKPGAAAGGLQIERGLQCRVLQRELRIVCMRVPAPCMPMITSAQRKNDAVCTNVKSP